MSDNNTFNLKQALDMLLRRDGKLKKQLTEAQVKRLWAEMMDNTVAPYTSKISFKNGRLKIWLTSAALREELNRGKNLIRKNMNEKIGEELIKEIIFL